MGKDWGVRGEGIGRKWVKRWWEGDMGDLGVGVGGVGGRGGRRRIRWISMFFVGFVVAKVVWKDGSLSRFGIRVWWIAMWLGRLKGLRRMQGRVVVLGR